MLKRVLIDLERHEAFFEVLSKALPVVTSLKATVSKKRAHKDVQGILVMQGDPGWRWNEGGSVYTTAELFVVAKDGKVSCVTVPYASFCSAVKGMLSDATWLKNLTSGDQRWFHKIPSFLYNILCKTQPQFCMTTKAEAAMPDIFAVGRYLYLQFWKEDRENSDRSVFDSRDATLSCSLPVHLAAQPTIVVKMVFWMLASSKVQQNNVLSVVGMLERTLADPNWWANYGSLKETATVNELARKVQDPRDEEVHRWCTFFRQLPGMIEYYHGKPHRAKKSKSKIDETTTKNLTFENAVDLLKNDGSWGEVEKARIFSRGKDLAGLLFTEKEITTEQVCCSFQKLHEEWGYVWATPLGYDTIFGNFMVTRTSAGALAFLPASWVSEIQERLLLLLCLHSHFKRRYSVPVAPWLTESYFSENPRDREIVIKAFYRLLHKRTSEYKDSLLASPADPELFEVYGMLHKILAHIRDPQHVAQLFKNAFSAYDNLLFKKKGKKRGAREVLVGIKNVPCLHRALKSLIEIKAQHFVEEEGVAVLVKHDIAGVGNLPVQPGALSQEQTLEIYALCASDRLPDADAMILFYHVRTDGEIMFTAKLPGVENWQSVSPFLKNYGEKMLKKIETATCCSKQNTENGNGNQCAVLFACFKCVEEMAHYPAHITYEEYNADAKYRGNLTETPLECDPRDFAVRENRCPLMLMADDPKGEPKKWFPEDMFPIYEGKLTASSLNQTRAAFANHIKGNPWRDMRPFDDAHPHLLEYLVT